MDQEPQPSRPREVDTVADLDSDPGDAQKLSTIGRYVILDSVGMGGMGLVCAAYDPKLNRKIALKLLRNVANTEASTAGRNRLFREAQALAKLSHPNVVTVHDVDVFEGQVYIAMEFVEGMTLREWIREEQREWKEILAKFILAGRGIAAAHAADIVHRDFKPSNVLLGTDGTVRVADFGVAKEREGSRVDVERERAEFERRRRTGGASSGDGDTTAEDALIEEIQSNVSVELTVAGRMVGTPAYMAPEQHMGLRVGPYTDQYSFCVSFYEALFGRLPFEGVDRRDQLARMTEGKLPPPPKEGPGRQVPSWLHRVLERGLKAHPTERWPSMDALLAALERDPVKRRRRLAILGAGVLGLCAGVVGVVFGLGADEDRCPRLAADIDEHWNDERRADVERAFEASSKPYADDAARRVVETLDLWTDAWARSRVQICEATRVGEQSEELLDVRIYCLDRQARELDALVGLFVEADDEIVERSVGAAHALANPAVCASVRDTGEIGEREQDELYLVEREGMESDLDRAFALASSGKFGESLPLQARVVARARELSHTRLLTRALFALSRSQFETGDKAGCEQSLRETIELAARLGDAEQEAQAWTRLIFFIGSKKQRFAEGHAWSLAASSALLRAGTPRRLELRYENSIAALELAEGNLEAGADHYRVALALAREEHGESHPNTIRTMMNYAIAEAQRGHMLDAEEYMLEVVSRSKDVYGQDHPWLATVYYNLGNLYLVDEQTDKAEQAFRQTLVIRERVGGPDAPNLAWPLHSLAKIAREHGRYEEALSDLERVVAIFRETRGEHSNEVAAALLDVAATQRALGSYEEANAAYDQVERIYAQIFPDGHLHVGGLERERCELFLDMQLWVEAVDACKRALDMDERYNASPETRRDVYELLIAAETGRGRTLAAEAARECQRALEVEIAESAAKD